MTGTDWNLAIQANLSLLWCQWCMQDANQRKTVGETLDEFRRQYQYEEISPFNVGTMIMASYILFVYPQQADWASTDFSKMETSRFTSHQGTKPSEKKRFCERIRNSLVHARFSVRECDIEFRDQKDKKESDPFCATISFADFGNFINEFMFQVKEQHV